MKEKSLGFLVVIAVAVVLLGVPILSGFVADFLFIEALDKDHAYLWISIHHIIQMGIILGFIIGLKRFVPSLTFGFTLGDKQKGLKYIMFFTLGFLGYILISFTLAFLSNGFMPYGKPLTPLNIIGYLGFQLLLSGPSEEILFRAFAMTLIGIFFKTRIFKGKLSVANLLAAIIFALAHISIYFSPFELSFNTFQLFYAFGLGLIYGDCYEKTGSIIYPMALHSISNVIAVGMTILFS